MNDDAREVYGMEPLGAVEFPDDDNVDTDGWPIKNEDDTGPRLPTDAPTNARGSDPMGEDFTHLRRMTPNDMTDAVLPASVWRNIAERHENELRELREQLLEAFGTDDVAAIARGFDKGVRALSGADTPATKEDANE